MKVVNKKWYKRKRYWLLIGLFLLFILSRMEFLKMRYQPDELREKIVANGQQSPHFKTKIYKQKQAIHFLEIIKEPSLPLVVLVHGSPGSLSAYEDYFSDTIFTKNLNVIAIDRPGFGYSDFGKTAAALSEQAAIVATVLKDFPTAKKILVGHSMGGPVIAKTAMDFPELVDGLVFVAPSVCPELEPSNTWRKIVDFPLIRWFTPPSLKVSNQEILPLKNELEKMMDDWKKLEMPITIIQGEMDNLVPAGNAPFIKKMAINSAKVELNMLENGNHFILWSEMPMIKTAILNQTNN